MTNEIQAGVFVFFFFLGFLWHMLINPNRLRGSEERCDVTLGLLTALLKDDAAPATRL